MDDKRVQNRSVQKSPKKFFIPHLCSLSFHRIHGQELVFFRSRSLLVCGPPLPLRSAFGPGRNVASPSVRNRPFTRRSVLRGQSPPGRLFRVSPGRGLSRWAIGRLRQRWVFLAGRWAGPERSGGNMRVDESQLKEFSAR